MPDQVLMFSLMQNLNLNFTYTHMCLVMGCMSHERGGRDLREEIEIEKAMDHTHRKSVDV